MKKGILMSLLVSAMILLPHSLFGQIQLTVDGTTVNGEKMYDGTNLIDNDNVTPGSIPSITGVYIGSWSALYDDKNVGNNKRIIVTYNLVGKYAGNYTAKPDTFMTGKITKKSVTIKNPVYDVKTYDATDDVVELVPASFPKNAIASGDNVTMSYTAHYDDASAGSSKVIIVNYSYTGTDVNNYSLTQVAYMSGEIEALKLTVTGTTIAQSKQYDGGDSCVVTFAGNLSGVIGSDDVHLVASAKYNDKTVNNNKPVTVAFSLTGSSAGNYLAPDSIFDKTSSITRRQLTATPTLTTSKIYDGQKSAACTLDPANITGIVSGDLVTVTPNATYDTKNVGTGKQIVVSYSHSGADAGNYLAPVNDTVNNGVITEADLTLAKATGVTTRKEYDCSDTAHVTSVGTLSGVVSGDVVTLNAEAHYYLGNTLWSDARDSLDIHIIYTLTGDDAANYNVPATVTLNDTGKITRKALTIDQPTTVADKVYDGSTNAVVTYPGSLKGVNACDLGYITLLATAKFRDANADSTQAKAVDVSYKDSADVTYDVIGTKANNYIEPDPVVLSARINPRQLTIADIETKIKPSKAYDGTNNDTTIQNVNELSPDIVGSDDIVITAIAKFDTKDVGTNKDISVRYTLSGNDKGNYIAPVNDTVGGNEIYGRQITISGTQVQASKEYDGTTQATVTNIGISDKLSGDSITITAVATYDNKNAGENKTVTVVYTITGPDSVNYSTPRTFTSTASISQRGLDIAAHAMVQPTKVYDGNTECRFINDTATLSGVLAGDTVFAKADDPAHYTNANVGTGKSVTLKYTLSGKDASNYKLNQSSATVSADITKRQLTATGIVVSKSKNFDGTANAAITNQPTLNGAQGTDVISLGAVAAYDNSNVGTGKPITVTYSISGTNSSNYDAPVGFTYATDGVIQALAPTVDSTEIESTKVYDGTCVATVTKHGKLTGLLTGAENVSVIATASYPDSAVGNHKLLTVTYQLTGADAQYYSTPTPTKTYYANITQYPLTVSGTQVVTSKTYDGSDSVHVTNPGSIYPMGTDVVNLHATAQYDNKNAGTGKNITINYTIDGAQAANYSVVTPVQQSGGVINKRGIDIVTDARVQSSKVYDGNANCAVDTTGVLQTYSATTPNGVISGDAVILVTTDPATYIDANVGTDKTVNLAYSLSGSDAVNYTLNRTSGTAKADITGLQLTQIGASVTQSKRYDGTTYANVITYGTLYGAGSADVQLGGTATYDNAQVGTGKTITLNFTLSGTAAGNYLAPVSATFTGEITDVIPVISGVSVEPSKVYDGTTDCAIKDTGSLSNLTEGHTNVTFTPTARYLDDTVGSQKKVVVSYTLGGSDASYYITPGNDTLYASITQRPLTVTGTNVETSKEYDGTLSVQVNNIGTVTPLNNDKVTLGGTAEYTNKNVGTGKQIKITYTISGADAHNYSAPAIAYIDTAVITQRGVSVITDATVDSTKAYDGNTNCNVRTHGTLQTYSQQNLDGVISGETVKLTANAAYRDALVGTNKMVDITYQLSGKDASNYYLLNPASTTTASITKKQLSVSGTTVNREKIYDGNTSATVSYNGLLVGIEGSDSVSFNAVATYDSAAVSNNRVITVVYQIYGDDVNNYSNPDDLVVPNCSITVTKLSVSEVYVHPSRAYDGTTDCVVDSIKWSGKSSGDDVNVQATATYDNKNAGTNKDVLVTFTLSGASAGSYVAPASVYKKADITQKQLTASTPQLTSSRVYDGTDTIHIINKGTLSGIVSGESVDFTLTARYADVNAGVNKTVNLSYDLDGVAAVIDNYLAPVDNTTTASIDRKQLTARYTGVTITKEYDGTTVAECSGSELQGVVGQDNVSVQDTANYNNPDVATGKTITVRYLLSGAQAANYIAPVDSSITNGVITAHRLTVTGTTYDATKVYDGTTTAHISDNGTLSGTVAGHGNVSVNATAIYDTRNVGTSKRIAIVYTLSGADASYYTAPDTMFRYDGEITAKPVTVSGATVSDKVYDGTTSATVTNDGTAAVLISGDVVTVHTTATFADPNIGTQNVNLTYQLTGTDAGNYSLTSATDTKSATISASTNLTVTTPQITTNKVYDGTNTCAVTVGTLTGYQPGDDVSITATATYDSKNVGTGKTITVHYTLSGAQAGNYTAPADYVTTGSITKANAYLQGTAVAATKVYDGTTLSQIAYNGQVNGLISPDAIQIASITAAYSDKKVGNGKPVTLTYTLSGDTANYNVINQQYLTANITKLDVYITNTTVSDKVYDGNTTATVTGNGTINTPIAGDDLSVSATATFTDATVGNNKTVDVTYTLGGADQGNYNLNPATGVSQASIKQASVLTVTGTQTQTSKVYDGTNSCTVTAGTLNGAQTGDDVTVTASATFDDKNVGTGKTIIITYTLGGADAGNYTTPANDTIRTGSITKAIAYYQGAAVTLSKGYDGTTNCVMTNFGAVNGVISPDNISIAIVTADYDNKNVGTGKIVTLTYTLAGDTANYNIINSNNLTADITKRDVSIYGTTVSDKVYDGTNTATVTNPGNISNMITGDNLTVNAVATFNDETVGSNKPVSISYTLGGADMNNYSLTPSTGSANASITIKSGLTVSNTTISAKTYDGTTTCPVTVGTLQGKAAGDNVTVTAAATFDNKNVGQGKTVRISYTLHGADSANYVTPADEVLSTGRITAMTVSLENTAVTPSREYDGTDTCHVTAYGTLAGAIATDDVNVIVTARYNDKNVGIGKNVALTYSLQGTDAANYQVQNNQTVTAAISERTVSISGAAVANKTYDGNTSATVTNNGTINNKISGDNLTVTTTATFGDAAVGSGKTVNLVYTLGGADVANYKLDTTGGVVYADITSDVLTVSGTVVKGSKTYDGTTTCTVTTVGTLSGVNQGDDVQLSASAAYVPDGNVGTGKTVIVTYTISGADAGNYNTPAPDTLSADITQMNVTLAGTQFAVSKVYDGTTAGPSVISNGYLSGAVDTTVHVTVSATFNDKNVGTNKSLNITYNVTGAGSQNYQVSNTQSLTADITARPVTVSGSVANGKTYDGTDSASVANNGTLSNTISGDDVYPLATASFLNVNAGNNRPVQMHFVLAGADYANYTLSPEYDTVYANISKKTLTVVGTTFNNPKQYDGNDTCGVSNVGTVLGLCGNDVVSLSAVASYDNKEQGTGKTITVIYTISGQDVANYNAPLTDSVNYGEITKRSIAVTGTTVAQSKVYDGNTNCVVTNIGSLVGLTPGDDVTISATAAYHDKNVGINKPVTVTYTATGANAHDYDIQADATLFADITCRYVTFTGTQIATGKTYDGSADAVVTAVGNTSDTIPTDAVTISATAHYTSIEPTNSTNVVVSYSISGTNALNYCTDSVTLPQTYTIAAATLALDSIDIAKTKQYDGTDIATVNYVNCLSSSKFGSDSVALSAVALYNDKNVANGKTITVQFSVSGPDAAKYVAPSAIVYNDGVITTAPLGYAGLAIDTFKMYDGNSVAKVLQDPTPVALFGSDVVTISTTAAFDNPNVGSNKTITAQFTLNGADAYNYSTPADTNLTNGRIFEEIDLNPSGTSGSTAAITTDADSYCQEDFVTLNYSVKGAGDPYQYRIVFSNDAKSAGFPDSISWTDYNYPADPIEIQVPRLCADGKYEAYVQFRNELQARDNLTPTRIDTVVISVRLSMDYITDIFYDVVSIDNREERFHSYQWYRDGVVIPGATLPYYQEIGGLDGVYSVLVNIGEATQNYVCEHEFRNASQAAPAYITAYPNPAVDEVNLQLYNFSDGEHNIRVVNNMGLGVLNEKFDGDTYRINVGSLPAGTYTVIVDGINVKVIKK